jgi:hypothetical protein
VLKPAKPVPEGKKIKCPKCGADFTTVAEEAVQELAIGLVPEEEPKAKEKSPAAAPRKKAGKAKAPAGKAPAAKKAKKPVDDDLDVNPYALAGKDEDEAGAVNYAPDTSIKDLRGPAQIRLIYPTNSLIVSGIIGFVGWLAVLVLILIPVLFPLNPDVGTKDSPREALKVAPGLGNITSSAPPAKSKSGSGSGKPTTAMQVWGIVDLNDYATYSFFVLFVSLIPIFVGLVYAFFLASGAVKCQNMESRGWGIASGIMVMFPINHCGFMIIVTIFMQFMLSMMLDDAAYTAFLVQVVCIIIILCEIGLGAWALSVFYSKKVVDGFNYKAE